MSPAFLKWWQTLFSNSGYGYYRWREVSPAAGHDLLVKVETWVEHQLSHHQELPSWARNFCGERQEALPRWYFPWDMQPNGRWMSSEAQEMSGKEKSRQQQKSGGCLDWWLRALGSWKRVQLSHKYQHDQKRRGSGMDHEVHRLGGAGEKCTKGSFVGAGEPGSTCETQTCGHRSRAVLRGCSRTHLAFCGPQFTSKYKYWPLTEHTPLP